MKSASFLLASATLFLCAFSAVAQTPRFTVEENAEQLAAIHNLHAKSMLDSITVATIADAQGAQVTKRYVMDVKRRVPPGGQYRQKLTEGLRSQLIAVCALPSNWVDIQRGLTFKLIYTTIYSEPVAEFLVDKELCDSLTPR